jgi:hypothetical protein
LAKKWVSIDKKSTPARICRIKESVEDDVQNTLRDILDGKTVELSIIKELKSRKLVMES